MLHVSGFFFIEIGLLLFDLSVQKKRYLMPLKTVLMFYPGILKKRNQFFPNKSIKERDINVTTKRVFFCVNSLHFEFCRCSNIFFSFFSDLSKSHRKKRLDLKIVFAVTSVFVFIAFCTVFGLYIKGNAQFNLITRNILLTL